MTTNTYNLPWYVGTSEGRRTILDKKRGFPLVQTNAEYIVHCVNNHDALVSALTLAERFIAAVVAERNEAEGEGTSTTLDIIQSALKSARGV